LPQRACLVPEKRQELTTEGGLDVIANRQRIKKIIGRLAAKKIEVSLFVDPDSDQIKCARSLGAYAVELHTGRYADAPEGPAQEKEFVALLKAAELAGRLKLHLHAGHGLNYRNVQRVAHIPGMEELNIGFAIMARAVFTGLGPAVREMKELLT
jgi:pyridoxine 5-phosphate synthase